MQRSLIALLLFLSAAIAAPPAGAIHGRVVEAKSGEPAKKAVVILRHAEEPGLGAVSDAAGEFQFEGIEPGAYTVTAEHSGFIPDPASRQTVVNVGSENNAEVTVKLVRTSAISGRVFDDDGDPITGANIQIVRVNGGPAANATTNDRGEYRAFNIQPGKYRIAVSYAAPFEEMQVKMQPAKGSRETGAPDTWAVTWYPSALDPNQGQIANIEAGADLGGFDVQILRTRAVTVKGTVIALSGAAPAFIAVALSAVRQTNSQRSLSDLIRDGSGKFEIGHVLPGTYIVEATALFGNQNYSAHRTIEVGNTNMDGIQLTLAPPQTIAGSFVVPEGRKMPSGLIVSLDPRDPDFKRGGEAVQVDPDGSFQIREVPPGDYDLVVGKVTDDDLYISAIREGDQDALAGIHIGGPPAEPLKIILKSNGGTVQVNVKDADGKPQPGYPVEVIPDPPLRKRRALYSRCGTDATGTCTMIGVAPGSYRVFAFQPGTAINPNEIGDVEDSGTPFTIGEGEKRQIEVKPVADDKPI